MLYFYNMSSESQDDLVFKALAHGRRRSLLDHLKDGPQTTGALCALFPDMDRCTVMQHLKVLEDAELIVARREGRERWNYLNAMPIKGIADRWISEYASHALSILGRLKADMDG
jgi:DNA-binding transcriptional ArsR family regulator